jgi:hypothetical protein
MTTKDKENVIENIYEQPISAEMILRPYTLTENIVNQARKINDENLGMIEVIDPWGKGTSTGTDSMGHALGTLATIKKKASQLREFVDFQPSPTKTKKLQFIKQTMNQRSKKFYTIESLIQMGVLHPSERELYKFPPYASDFPYRTVYQYRRVQRADKTEYLTTHEYITSVDDQGTVVSIALEPHTYIVPNIIREKRNTDGTPLRPGASIANTDTVQVSIIKSNPNREVFGKVEYLTPFTKEVVLSALRFAHGELGDRYNGASMTIVKENYPQSYSVFEVDEFVNANFNDLWNRLTKPPAGPNTGIVRQPYV